MVSTIDFAVAALPCSNKACMDAWLSLAQHGTRWTSNTSPVQAVTYFLDPTRVENAAYFDRFLDIIKHPSAQPLLKQTSRSLPQLIALLRPPPDPPDVQDMRLVPQEPPATFHAVHLLAKLVKLLPDWLPDELFTIVQARWRSRHRLYRCA